MAKYLTMWQGASYVLNIKGRGHRLILYASKAFAGYLNKVAKKHGSKCVASIHHLTREQFENDVCGGRYMYYPDGKYPALFIDFPDGRQRKYATHHLYWMVNFRYKPVENTESEFEDFVEKMLLTYDNNFNMQ